MRPVTLNRAISIMAALPPDLLVRARPDPAFDPYSRRLIFPPAPLKYLPAGKVVERMKYYPCLLSNSKSIGEYVLCTQTEDYRVVSELDVRDFISQDGNLLVREFEEGKYTAVFHDVTFSVLRHDSPWRDFVGDKFVTCLFLELLGNR